MNQRVITTVGEKTSHYQGHGYEYFFESDKQKGRQCKLRCPKSMLEDFEKSKGRINSVGMPHLEILQQAPGWWLVCSDRPENDGVVTEFIAKFNRWNLARQAAKEPQTRPVRNYVVTAPIHVHGQQRRSSAQPAKAEPTDLRALADTINAKFGHTRRK